METLYERVRYYVNKYDSCRFIEHHSGVDVYKPEIERIIPEIRGTKKPEVLQERIYTVFKEILGEENAGPIEQYLPLAKELLAMRKERK